MKKHLFSLLAMLTAFSTSAFALDKVNGAYQIGTVEDYVAFAQIVNGGTRDANAILTADIDLGSTTTQIGVGGDYQGLFDGAGHTITINLPDRTDGEGPALFRGVGNRGIVQNLKVQGTIATGTYKHTAALANYTAGIIRCCFADVTINASFADNADASIGGIAGQLNRPAVIENCLSKIKIVGSTTHKCGGLAAWVDAQRINIVNCLVINDKESNFNWSDGKSAGLVRDGDGLRKAVDLSTYNADSYKNRPQGANANNYVTNDWGVLSVGTAVVTPEEVASGKVCYQLNSDQSHIGWVQNIGDPYPVPAVFGKDKKQVYASAPTNCQGKADGEVTFGNVPTDVIVTKHTYDKYGVCTTCGQFNWNCFDFEDPTRFDPATKSVLLGNADDLYLAEGWNRLQNGFKLNMKMVNDITCTPPTGQLIFNAGDWMDSNFDGDGHTITINFVDIKENCAAFLPYFDGNFENVIMHGSISTANQYAGSIAGRFYGNGQKIRNVFSDITINSTRSGDNTTGGFVGISNANCAFENCIYAGDIIGIEGSTCFGGFVGWANGGNNSITNCAFLGTMTNAGGDSHAISRNNGQINSKNVYSTYHNGTDLNKYTFITSDDVKSGKLCYLLNGKQEGLERFYQSVDTDPMPMPFAKENARVYATAYCGEVGNAIGFVNTPTTPAVVSHQFENGFCSDCGEWDETFMTPVDGWFNISNGAELAWWSIYESKKEITNARLTDDIDVEKYSKYYTPVGTQAKLFTGKFDGQGHTISNLTVRGGDYTGLFGAIGSGAEIKNFILDNTCAIYGNAFVGAIGGTNGSGNVYISNIGNEGTVTGAAQNASGIIGVDMSGAMDMFITNCYVTGAVKGDRESATICSWSSNNSKVTNCWSIAPMKGIYGTNTFTRGNTAVINCYEIESVGQQNGVNKIPDADVKSGKFCYTFNQSVGENILGQNLVEGQIHPTFADNTGYTEVLYDEELGYYNPLPLRIITGEYENTENAGVKATYTFVTKVSNFTDNAIALIMEAEDYEQNGIYKAKHLFGAVAKNGNFNVTDDGKLEVNFACYSGHTAQPNFAGDLERADVGDVKADSKYVVVIYGGSIAFNGAVYKDNIVQSYTGSELLSLVVDQAIENVGANDPTAINGINADKNAEIYSISGTRVNKAQKGVYIINGQKAVIK